MQLIFEIPDDQFFKQIADLREGQKIKTLILNGVTSVTMVPTQCGYTAEYFIASDKKLYLKPDHEPYFHSVLNGQERSDDLKKHWKKDRPAAIKKDEAYALIRLKYQTNTIEQTLPKFVSKISALQGFVRVGTFSEFVNGTEKRSFGARANVLTVAPGGVWLKTIKSYRPYYHVFDRPDDLIVKSSQNFCTEWLLSVVDVTKLPENSN